MPAPLLPWVLAGTAVLGAATNMQQRNRASVPQQRPQAGNYTPTAGQYAAPPEAMDFASGPPPASAPPPQRAPSNTLANVNDAVQTGATLQQIFSSEQDRRRARTNAALANAPRPGPATPYQPTASGMMDPRLSQIYGGR